jgi:hypothetical protein
MVVGGDCEGGLTPVVLGFLFISISHANTMAVGSGFTSTLPQSFLPQAHNNGVEG